MAMHGKRGWRATGTAMAAGALLFLSAPAMAGGMPKRLRAMTPDDFRAAVAVGHDADGRRTILSTQPAFVPQPLSPIRHLLSDNHLRAVIDRDSGAVRYEVHQSIFYWGPRRSFTAAHVPAASGARRADLTLAEHGERFCPNEDNWGPCASTKRVAFAIDESDLRAIAARYRADGGQAWPYRIEERGGQHWTDGISPAEAAGLLLATESLRTTG